MVESINTIAEATAIMSKAGCARAKCCPANSACFMSARCVAAKARPAIVVILRLTPITGGMTPTRMPCSALMVCGAGVLTGAVDGDGDVYGVLLGCGDDVGAGAGSPEESVVACGAGVATGLATGDNATDGAADVLGLGEGTGDATCGAEGAPLGLP